MSTHPQYSLQSLRRFPPSPSDTDHDLDIHSTPARHPGAGFATERSGYQPPRRTSALSYQNNSAPRDLRDRSYSRNSRNLVVVIPPPDLSLEHGQLGNVLSMGPRHRLSQGILMPLFPSMFAQLNAIAREYNFPSTVGLCLFLHINENGTTMTPRISDDSWQYLFGHLFDGRSFDGRQLPIGGSIEFDIDLRKARWFDAWVSGTLPDSASIHPPVPNSSDIHWRGESQTEEHPVEDRWNASGSHTLVTNSRPETLRHLPKKLSLVDRLDSHGVHVSLKPQDHPNRSGSSPTHGTYASSPIIQSLVPQSDLERRVTSWRASTELYPSSMAETYQPATDVGVSKSVTAMDEYALARNLQKATRIDEFLRSVTSQGPRTPPPESPIASRPSSVHLDRRANGTVPLTPTTIRTSWGPNDDEWHSVVSSATRLPSPDMGERAVDDVMAPRPRAVWGNSFGWRSAATWKQVYPYSLILQLHDSKGPVPQYPNLEIYPYVNSQSLPDTSKHPSPSSRSVWGSSFGWQRTVTWRMTYPYSVLQSVGSIQLRRAGISESQYPNLNIYPAVYPYFEIYPACSIEDISQPVSVTLSGSDKLLAPYPSLVIYPPVYPHLDIYPLVVEDVSAKGSGLVDTNIYPLNAVSTLYPNLVIYPAIYPNFDLYPKVLQISETVKQKEADVKLVNAGCLTTKYPIVTIYPGTYPHLEIYPVQHTRKQPEIVVWGLSFGWLTAKTWAQVYPFQTAGSLMKRPVDDQSKFVSKPGNGNAGTLAVWGNSFGWKSATTWHAVWPTPYAQTYPNVDLVQQNNSYPHLVIYSPTYPHFDIYPLPAAESTKEAQITVDLIPHYPNLVIYPAAYPHFDLYPASSQAVIVLERGRGEFNLRRRRIETWRARTAAQVGLSELLVNNHIWEVDEPLQLDLAEYAWSRTSAGPGTSSLESLDTPSISRSVHIDRRIQGSVSRTPSTATTWGPQDDDDWYSDIDGIERLPSPDLGHRVLDDVENIEFPWYIVFEQSVSISKYPHLVIYPPVYPHFELYPVRVDVSTSDEATKILVDPVLTHPVVYSHFNIYPAVDLQIEIPSKRHPPLYPNFDIYPPVHPSKIPYPPAQTRQSSEPEQSPVSLSTEWELVGVKLPIRYPLLELYPAGYPWSLESIYPAVSVHGIDDRSVVLEPQYPCIRIYSSVYPFVEPYPCASDSVQVPGTLDEDEYESAKACLASSEFKPVIPQSTVYVHPYFDLYSAAPVAVTRPGRVEQDAYVSDLMTRPLWADISTRRHRKTHQELHDLVFRSLGKQPARISKTHLQLHTEVFQNGVVWTPSGYTQDLSSLIMRRWEDVPAREFQSRHSRKGSPPPRPVRSRSGTTSAPSPDKVGFTLGQPPPLPLLSPLRIRSPPQPSPPVSETPTPRGSPTSTHIRTRSARLTQAVKAMMPGHRRHFSDSPASFPTEDQKEHAKNPTRFLSLVDRRSTPVPSSTPEFLTRTPRNASAKESFVMQRAKEQTNASVGARGSYSPFVLPPLPPLPSMIGVAEVIEKSQR